MILTLLSTSTASDADTIDITSNIDSTYDEYMFVMTDIKPEGDGVGWTYQFNASGETGFNETITSSTFRARHDEADSYADLSYRTQDDQAQGTAYQMTYHSIGSAADETISGILHLFSPSSTTYVKHFYSRTVAYSSDNAVGENHVAGYINTTAAIDEISFKMDASTFDGVIQMYGVA